MHFFLWSVCFYVIERKKNVETSPTSVDESKTLKEKKEGGGKRKEEDGEEEEEGRKQKKQI